MAGKGIFADAADKMYAKAIADGLRPDGPAIDPVGEAYHVKGEGKAGATVTAGEVEEHRLRHRLSGVGFGIGTALRNIILNVLVWGTIIAAVVYAQSHGVDILGWFRGAFEAAREWIASL